MIEYDSRPPAALKDAPVHAAILAKNPGVPAPPQKKSVSSFVSDGNNAVPSTPNSLKNTHNDSLNDTSPSSFNDDENRDGATFTMHSSSTASTKPVHLEIDPLHVPEGTEPSDFAEAPSHLHKFKHSMSLANHRRHTAPVNVVKAEAAPKKHSVDSQASKRPSNHSDSPVKRATRASLDLFPRQSTFESTNSEIQRMRNTFLAKAKVKKRRKDFLEDDKVLIGNKISEGHDNFVMAYNMLTGIRVAVSRCSGIMRKLTDADFSSYKKLTFNMDGSELTPSSKYDFKFKDYCPEVFRELRSHFGLDPADYLISITGKYILSELGSPGKSGSFFYFSRDYRYIIKTIHHSEHKQLRRILKHYYEHVKGNPNTLISQIYGLHRVKMPLVNGVKRKVHFLVMNNLFPPHRDIHLKYDLKGSTWGRMTRIDDTTDLSKTTLKDLNWLDRHDTIKFGPDKRKVFFKQLESDVKFLKQINVMDYSLLLGVHDVKKGNDDDQPNMLSVFDPKSHDKRDLIKTNPKTINREDLPTDVFRGRSKFIFYGHDGGIRSTDPNNNPSSEIYYMGIIDFLTNYSLKKKLETFWRSMSHTRSTISALPAREYGDRFLNFIKTGTNNAKTKAE